MPEETAKEVRQETVRILKMSKEPRNNTSRTEMRVLHTLGVNVDLTVLPIDNGSVTVILNTMDYIEIFMVLLDDPALRPHTVRETENYSPHQEAFTS